MTLQGILDFSVGSLSVGGVVNAAVLLVICLIIIKFIMKMVDKVLSVNHHIPPSFYTFIRSGMKVALYFVTVLIVTGSLGIETSSLLAVFSLVGLAFSLALQNSLSNLASGVLLLVTQPFEVGNFVDAAGISHFYGHPAKGARMADAICRRLRCDGALRHRVVRLIELHDERTTPTLPAVRRLMRRTELPVLRQLFLLQRADAAGQAPATRPAKFARIAQVEALVSRVLDEGLCFTTRQLCVNGDDLAAIGVARGPQMGLFLERLLDEVVDERLENNRQALLSQAVRWLASPGENSQKSHK